MEDSNCWDCSVCTYRNSAEAFKCLMCDVRKGTSTRKPRINPEMVAKQVARQQEQIKQQALKSAVKSKPGSSDKICRKTDDSNSNSSIASSSSSGRNSPIANGSPINSLDSSTASSSFFDTLSNKINTASCSKAINMPSSSRNSVKTLDSQSDNEVDENEDKVTVLGRIGNKGRKTKYIIPKAKLKNVDRTDVFCREVTVNNVTVLITEFKLKKRKLSEVSENQSKSDSSSSKKASTSKNSPDKNAPKETVSSSRSKASSGDKKFSVKGSKGGKQEVKQEVKEESPTSKKRSATSNDHAHPGSSKKLASSVDGN